MPATCPYPEPDQSSHCLHIINNILITRHAWEITEMQTEFWCKHTYTEENHNNVLYQGSDISYCTPTGDHKLHTYRTPQTAHLQETSDSTPTGYLTQHTYRRPQTAHLQDISNSTPTGDLRQHTYRISKKAHLQETSDSTPTGHLKQQTYRRPQTAHLQYTSSTPTRDKPAVAHVASTVLICKNLYKKPQK